jgi:DNA-binding SARP family transcriptional activator
MEESVALLKTMREPATLAVALVGAGVAALNEGRVEEAAAPIDEALQILDNQPLTTSLPLALYWRGAVAGLSGKFDAARQLFEYAVMLGRALASRPATAHPLYMLGQMHLRRGAADRAVVCLSESLDLHAEVDDRWGIYQVLLGFAELAATRDPDRAARLLGASEATRSSLGVKVLPPFLRDYETLLKAVRGALGDTAFEEACEAGRQMAPDAMAAYATQPFRVKSPRVDPKGRRVRPAAADLTVRALGSFEAVRRATVIRARAWESAKAREMLVLLLCHPAGLSRERLAADLWPELSPAQVRNNFHVTLHRLRRALGAGDVITVRQDRYAIDPELQVTFDVVDFERDARAIIAAARARRLAIDDVDAALAQYRGDFLEDEQAGDWHTARRQSLLDLYIDASLACGDALAEAERFPESLACYRRVLARDELNEAAVRGVIAASAALGDLIGARRAFERLTETLRRELDAAPQPETASAYRTATELKIGN